MAKYIVGLIVIIAVAVGGYYAYMTYGSPKEGAGPEGNTADIVQAQDTTVGTGAEATPGSIVSILYVGSFTDGTVFDSSDAHKDPETGEVPTLDFALGTPGIIAGFQIGVNGMKEGGERVIVVPPTHGYGTEDVKDQEGNVVIPGNSTLIFNVKLLKVTPPPADSATPETE